MHRLAVSENDDAQPAPASFIYSGPTAYAAIHLRALVLRTRDYPGNPRLADSCAVAARSNHLEVVGGLHPLGITTLCRHSG
jgi:hypothetical protein